MNDEQRQLAIKVLQEDVKNLKAYNDNYEREIREMEERIAPLRNQIARNLEMINTLNSVVAEISVLDA